MVGKVLRFPWGLDGRVPRPEGHDRYVVVPWPQGPGGKPVYVCADPERAPAPGNHVLVERFGRAVVVPYDALRSVDPATVKLIGVVVAGLVDYLAS